MARYRTYSLEFKRRVAEEVTSGDRPLREISRRHDVSRNLIRLWVQKFEAGEFDDEHSAAGLLAEYRCRIEELERKVGQLVMENDLLKKRSRTVRQPNAARLSVMSGPPPSVCDEDAS